MPEAKFRHADGEKWQEGAAFGPFIAGPEGCELYEVMIGDPRSWAADPEGWQRLLAAQNARQLPNPPIDLPAWIEDTRTQPAE